MPNSLAPMVAALCRVVCFALLVVVAGCPTTPVTTSGDLGKLGGPCRGDGSCDTGLVCVDDVCRLPVDAGADGGGGDDGGLAVDAGDLDAGQDDAGIFDGGVVDGGDNDAGPNDAGSLDGGFVSDGGVVYDGGVALGGACDVDNDDCGNDRVCVALFASLPAACFAACDVAGPCTGIDGRTGVCSNTTSGASICVVLEDNLGRCGNVVNASCAISGQTCLLDEVDRGRCVNVCAFDDDTTCNGNYSPGACGCTADLPECADLLVFGNSTTGFNGVCTTSTTVGDACGDIVANDGLIACGGDQTCGAAVDGGARECEPRVEGIVCVDDTDCSGGTCHPTLSTCVPAGRGTVCTPCDANAECGTHYDRCVTVTNSGDGTLLEKVCGQYCAVDDDCPRGYACSFAGGTQCYPVPGPLRPHTCGSLDDTFAETDCADAGNAGCGLENFNDGLCTVDTSVCTIDCTDDAQCPLGTSCQPTAGISNVCLVD